MLMTRSIIEETMFDGQAQSPAPSPELLGLFAERGRELGVGPGEMVFHEGDQGDMMYLVTSGSVQVFARAFDGTDVVFARLGPGHVFGEQALLPEAKSRRSASVRAVTHCELLALVREDAPELLDNDGPVVQELRRAGEVQRRIRHRRLREDVLRHLGVAGRYGIERFAPGQVVCHQGAPGRKVHLLLSGTAAMLVRHDDEEETIAEIRPGLLLGEQALLYDEFHAASIVAVTDLEAASLDGAWFRDIQAHSPQLRALVEAQTRLYRLPRRDLLRLQGGTQDSHPTLTATQQLPDGRLVESTCVVGHAAFSARVVDAPEATTMHRFEDPQAGRMRALHLADGRIVEIESDGGWTQLPTVMDLMLDGTMVDQARVASLSLGGLGPSAPSREYVCHCARVSLVQLERVIQSGCKTLEQVARATRATRDCGECTASIKELLGDADWSPARCESIVPITEDVRTFHLRPLRSKCLPWLPGQHIVVQARIDGRWIARPYTISGAAGNQETYEITVKREPNGTMSQWLFDRIRGDSELRVSTPAGTFSLAVDHTRDVVCLVGGIGVTPALAMARTLAAAPRPLRLFVDYSVSRASQAIYREELEGFHDENPRIQVNLRITERDGRLDGSRVRELAREYPDASFYLCGRRAYMDAMERYLAEAGVAPDHVSALNFRSEAEWYAGSSGSWPMARIVEPDAPRPRRRLPTSA